MEAQASLRPNTSEPLDHLEFSLGDSVVRVGVHMAPLYYRCEAKKYSRKEIRKATSCLGTFTWEPSQEASSDTRLGITF